eukprot:372643_1
MIFEHKKKDKTNFYMFCQWVLIRYDYIETGYDYLKIGCDAIIINNRECVRLGSCTDSIFNLIGDIKIENCNCGPSCNTAILSCFTNLQSIECSNPYSCQNQMSTIINPINGFELY